MFYCSDFGCIAVSLFFPKLVSKVRFITKSLYILVELRLLRNARVFRDINLVIKLIISFIDYFLFFVISNNVYYYLVSV